MGLVDRLKAKHSTRLDELIEAGKTIPMEQHSRQTSYNSISGRGTSQQYQTANWPTFVEWRTSCVAVLDQIVPEKSLLRKTVSDLTSLANAPSKVQFLIGFLRSVRTELNSGAFDELAQQIEAEILSDYLTQASELLAGSKTEPNHIAAAVVCGAALERTLRSICAAQLPEEPTTTDKGAPVGMNGMIEALKKRKVFNELTAKELRSWAALRNLAAHGDFDAFDRQQVEAMASGVSRFVTQHAH